MSIGVGIACLLIASIPPLSPEQRTRLATAYDGRDHQEEAFVALLENARTFRPDPADHPGRWPGDTPVRLNPDPELLLADPESSRGSLFRVDGALAQRTPLDGAFAGVEEWFVRDGEGRPLLVYVDVTGDPRREDGRFVAGRSVAIYARFYKRVDATARDGTLRRYPAFVGANAWTTDDPASGGDTARVALVLVGLVLVLGVVFGFVIVVVRRPRPRPPRALAARSPADVVLDDGGPLPDDPADALAELRRRAEADE